MANKAPNYEGVGCEEPYVLTDAECNWCEFGLAPGSAFSGRPDTTLAVCTNCNGSGYVTEKVPLRDFLNVED